jgi:hypothetical protein
MRQLGTILWPMLGFFSSGMSSSDGYNREVSHQYEYDNQHVNYFSNNQMVLNLQAENVHISKQINKIIFVCNVTNFLNQR